MKPKISVIVPVYNVEKYLERCLRSIINQTYKNLEIILVDDGSNDGSGSICDKYAKIEARIRVVHKMNGGSSSARNVGILASNGEYVTFVDSDDWIALDTYEYCLNLISNNDADSVQYNFIMVTEAKPVKQRKEKIDVFLGKDILRFFLNSSTRTGSYSVCRCLFPRRALDGVLFREGRINEDIDFKYKALSNCRKLIVSNQYKYYYFQSGFSNSTGGLKTKDFALYEAAQELYLLTSKEENDDIRFLGLAKKARTPFSLLAKIAYYGVADAKLDKNDLVRELVSQHRENIVVLLKSPMAINRKILAVMFALNYKCTEFLIGVLRGLKGVGC